MVTFNALIYKVSIFEFSNCCLLATLLSDQPVRFFHNKHFLTRITLIIKAISFLAR
jgi:hypothetical protein